MRAVQSSGVEPERLDKASIQGGKAVWGARAQDRTGRPCSNCLPVPSLALAPMPGFLSPSWVRRTFR